MNLSRVLYIQYTHTRTHAHTHTRTHAHTHTRTHLNTYYRDVARSVVVHIKLCIRLSSFDTNVLHAVTLDTLSSTNTRSVINVISSTLYMFMRISLCPSLSPPPPPLSLSLSRCLLLSTFVNSPYHCC